MMMMRTTVHDRYGAAIGEFDAKPEKVSWRMNKVGVAPLEIARADEKATSELLKFNNRLLVQFDNGLPDWGGIIVPPRNWDKTKIKLTNRDGGEILNGRMTASTRGFTQVPAGTIYQTLIEEANAELDTGIDIGTIWTGGAVRSPATYHFDRLLPKIQALTKLTGNDFAIVPVVTSGTLRFRADWFQERGTDKSDVALIEGHNVEVTKFEEYGPIINHWAGFGEGSTWSEKPTSEARDLESQSLYGLLESARAFSGVTNQDTLDDNVAELLLQTRYVRVRINLQAINLAPALFADYDIGDRIGVRLHSYGFLGSALGYESTIRLVERTFHPSTGKCSLIVENEV